MLQGATHNSDLALSWSASGRLAQGKGPVLTEGYSQDDIKNGFRVDSLTPKPLGDRLKMGCAALFSILIPVFFLAALLFITGSWLLSGQKGGEPKSIREVYCYHHEYSQQMIVIVDRSPEAEHDKPWHV